jgi:hypothetical protein
MNALLNLKKNECTVEAMQPGTLAYSIVEGIVTLLVLMFAIGLETVVALAYLWVASLFTRKGRRGRRGSRSWRV